jgi:hypothetical protein
MAKSSRLRIEFGRSSRPSSRSPRVSHWLIEESDYHAVGVKEHSWRVAYRLGIIDHIDNWLRLLDHQHPPDIYRRPHKH